MSSRQNLDFQLAISEHMGMISTESDHELIVLCHGEQDGSPSFGMTIVDGASYHKSKCLSILLRQW